MTTKRIVRSLLLALCLAVPVGFAQDGVTQFGSVTLAGVGVMGADQTVATARFFAFEEEMELSPRDAFFSPERIDTCVESQEDQMAQPTPPEVGLPVDEGTEVSAGAEIRIEADGSTFAVLTRQGDAYMARVSQPLPTSATVDIPGSAEGFPAFSERAFPEPRPVAFTSPGDLQSIDGTTTFRWEPTDELAVVMIVMQGAIAGAPSGGVVCFAADDGEFSLEGRAGLENVTPQSVAMYGRNVARTYREGSALLTLSVFSTTLAMEMPRMPSAPN